MTPPASKANPDFKSYIEEIRREWKAKVFPAMTIEAAFRYVYAEGFKDALAKASVRGRLAQLENKLVDEEIIKLEPGEPK